MAIKKYQFKFYMNARHSLSPDDVHAHTWELAIEVINKEKKYVIFNELERIIENYLEYYENIYLNDVKPFDQLLPIIENMGDVFAYDLEHIFNEKKIYLYSLAISENPIRTYEIVNDGNGFENPLENIQLSDPNVMELKQSAEIERVQQRLGRSPSKPHDDNSKKKRWSPFSGRN